MIFKDDKYINIAEFDANGEIRFTNEYLELTKELAGGARRFASYVISHWTEDFGTLLDYFGSDLDEQDKYTGIDGMPMDVREDITDLWEYYGKPYQGLEGEWYRDVLRSKLISVKLPERIIKSYVNIVKKNAKEK